MALISNTGIPDKAWQPRYTVLETSMGDVVIELYWRHAPRTCANFAELARRGYYNNTIFHRIIRDFMIQGGDPTGTGKGGTSIYGKEFADEIHDELKHTGSLGGEKEAYCNKESAAVYPPKRVILDSTSVLSKSEDAGDGCGTTRKSILPITGTTDPAKIIVQRKIFMSGKRLDQPNLNQNNMISTKHK